MPIPKPREPGSMEPSPPYVSDRTARRRARIDGAARRVQTRGRHRSGGEGDQSISAIVDLQTAPGRGGYGHGNLVPAQGVLEQLLIVAAEVAPVVVGKEIDGNHVVLVGRSEERRVGEGVR